ncbi:MAG: hypothetical protein ABSA83_09135 [Verrucomicrobiota bacterium]|jgi:hypothetical protein
MRTIMHYSANGIWPDLAAPYSGLHAPFLALRKAGRAEIAWIRLTALAISDHLPRKASNRKILLKIY